MLIADDDELVHLVITIGNEKIEAEENTDTVSGLKEFQRRSQALC
jgi:hypothetical protein